MKGSHRRILGYGTGLAAASALVYVGVVVAGNTRADVDTLLGSAEVQIRLASSLPPSLEGGRPNPARQTLLNQVRTFLDQAQQQEPRSMPVRELRAHLHYLEGDYREAASVYGQLAGRAEATASQRDTFVINQVRMLMAAGDARAAERVLGIHEKEFLPQNRAKSRIEKANVLLALDQRASAIAVVNELVASVEEPVALMEAGCFLERRSDYAAAARAYDKAASRNPLADYYRARLKIRKKEFDSGLDLLERAMAHAAQKVRVLLRQDDVIWKPCRGMARFEDLLGESAGKSAQPGR